MALRDPAAVRTRTWGIFRLWLRRRDRSKANLRKFRRYSSNCQNQKCEAISGGFVADETVARELVSPLLLPVFPCYVRKNRQVSLLVEQPPVNIFSSSVVFSVGYGVFPSLQELRSFLRKTGIFFNVSGTLDLITGENSKRLRKRQLRSSPLLSQGTPGHPRARVHIRLSGALRVEAPVGTRQKPRIS